MHSISQLSSGDPTDVAALLDLLRSARGYTRRVTGHEPGPADVVDILTARPPALAPGAKLSHGLWDGQELVAFADVLLGYPDDRHAYVGLLLVRGDRRGEGLGRDLHEEVLAVVRATGGLERLRLSVVDTNAAEAEPFWAALGYVPTGDAWPYSQDEVVSTARAWARPVELPS